ncbi:MAG: Methylase of polypeptide chain release factor [Parcubacteria group bacterium LiPW_41]|nr:MAG: Methylase of polypeptide chain release factor [Parcubacteria group bacterium LiPW_41]
MRTYTPKMSETEIAKRREWMRRVREDVTRSEKEKKIRLSQSSVNLMVPWGVHPPLWDDSLLLAEVVEKEIQPNMSVLDIGTGSGIQGIVAALRGAFVLSTDICPRAVQTARWNADRYRLEKMVEARESDCFNHVREKFDRIVFNPPHLWFESESILDHIITDNNYVLFRRFLNEAKKHLEESGKIFLMCSTIGDVEYMQECIKENEYEMKVCASRISPSRWHYAVYELS